MIQFNMHSIHLMVWIGLIQFQSGITQSGLRRREYAQSGFKWLEFRLAGLLTDVSQQQQGLLGAIIITGTKGMKTYTVVMFAVV